MIEQLKLYIKELEKDAAFVSNPHDHETDRAVGQAYINCAKRLSEIIDSTDRVINNRIENE